MTVWTPENAGEEAEDSHDTLPNGVSLADFYAFMPMHNYIFAPTRDTWPAGGVNARCAPIPLGELDEKGKKKTMKASLWLDQNQSVEMMTWAPGLPMIIENKLIAEGGWFARDGVRCFNLYLPPTIKPGDKEHAGRWLNHVHKVFPDDAEHIIKWLAHRRQRPHEKINHALVLGGKPGIGKDTLLEPAKRAVGPWNFAEVSPKQTVGRFNGFLKSVILRISEARDLGELDRFQFYDHMKAYTAAPPDVLRVDEKNLREHSVPNCCGVVITTNHKTDGIYLPADDRRHYVAWSRLTEEDFSKEYWNDLWGWYENSGFEHATAYLDTLDLSGFDAKAPPPKTAAFWAIVDTNRAPEEPELTDALDRLGNPDAVTLIKIQNVAPDDFAEWLRDRKNRRIVPHRFEKCGYVPARNPDATDGLWIIAGRRQAVYVKTTLSLCDQIIAARNIRSSST